MVVRDRSFLWGDVPNSYISLNLGIIASIVSVFSLVNLILNPLDFSGELSQEIQNRVSNILIWLVSGFWLGMISWMVGFVAFPINKKQPRWRTCRICSSIGIGFGLVAVLIYFVVLVFLPVPSFIPLFR